MLSVNALEKRFGGRTLLESAGFRLGEGEKVALVGVNGSGKSTLLRMCAGEVPIDGGEISLPGDAVIGYLPQHADLDPETTVYEQFRSIFNEADGYLEEIETLGHRMGEVEHDSPEFEKISDRYGFVLHEVDRLGAYEIDPQIDKVLTGLGFGLEDRDKKCSALSGGWQMRVVLGKVLLSHPDLLLLDEPTNHLDLETMIWLENWIRNSQATVLLVSHERKFMDALVTRVFEVHEGQLTIYRGNYSDYIATREERWAQWEREFRNQVEEIERMETFIRRFRYNAAKAALVQSRIKQLKRVERIPPPPKRRGAIRFRFPQPDRGSKEVLALAGGTKSYGDHRVLDNIDFTLWRGEKVALVGLNGAGKTTLLKILAKQLDPNAGDYTLGMKTQFEYFAQYDRDGMAEENTVWQEIASVAPVGQAEEARSLLGGFSFRGDDIEKPVSVLSGGERTRVRLAKMLFSGANLLLLDEPTNHLDVESRGTLERALASYEGSTVLVSHDRVFLDAVATRVVEIRDGKVRSFHGNYSDYCAALEVLGETSLLVETAKKKRGPAASPGQAPTSSSTAQVTANDVENVVESAAQPETKNEIEDARQSSKERAKEERGIKKRIGELEREIESIEARKGEIDEEMLRPAVHNNPKKFRPLVKEQHDLNERHEACLKDWETQNESLEAMKAEERGAA